MIWNFAPFDGIFLFVYFGFYYFGAFPSEERDKKKGTVDTNLPLWAKRILFLYKKNPFAKNNHLSSRGGCSDFSCDYYKLIHTKSRSQRQNLSY